VYTQSSPPKQKEVQITEPDGSEPLSICARNRSRLVDTYHIDAMIALRYYSDNEPVSERDKVSDLKSIDHVRKCPKCREWIHHVIPKDIMRRQHRLCKYCCAGMFVAVEEPKSKKSKITFYMFRGEDPCWQIKGVVTFISYCPWCGKKMPEKPFIE
jgi:hypothetical protein